MFWNQKVISFFSLLEREMSFLGYKFWPDNIFLQQEIRVFYIRQNLIASLLLRVLDERKRCPNQTFMEFIKWDQQLKQTNDVFNKKKTREMIYCCFFVPKYHDSSDLKSLLSCKFDKLLHRAHCVHHHLDKFVLSFLNWRQDCAMRRCHWVATPMLLQSVW